MSQQEDTKQKSKSGPDWAKSLAAVGGLIGAIAALLTALHAIGAIGRKEPVPTPVPTTAATAQAVATPTQPLLMLEDDFSNPKSGWDSAADADAEWGYQDGEYRIVVHAPEMTVWANTHERHDLANLVVVVEARRVAGPLDNQYGVIIRYQNRANFYLFTVSSDGMYAVQMLLDDEWKDVVEWTSSPVIRQGESTNVLRVEARGQQMRFLVNDELVATFEDDTLRSGRVGLAAGSFAEGGVEVRFDNLLVRQLP